MWIQRRREEWKNRTENIVDYQYSTIISLEHRPDVWWWPTSAVFVASSLFPVDSSSPVRPRLVIKLISDSFFSRGRANENIFPGIGRGETLELKVRQEENRRFREPSDENLKFSVFVPARLCLIVCLFHVPELTFSHKPDRASSHKSYTEERQKKNLNIIEKTWQAAPNSPQVSAFP